MSLDSLSLAALAGITYRQLDYWTRCGYVSAGRAPRAAVNREASGVPRSYTDDEAAHVLVMASLVHAGVATATAAQAARDAITYPDADSQAAPVLVYVAALPGPGNVRVEGYAPALPTEPEAPTEVTS